jgi:hypothetical protein
MKHIKLFENWINESDVDFIIERSLDIVIYYCLEALQVDGGNSNLDVSTYNHHWKKVNSIFGEYGPDLWVNTELPQCEKEIDMLRRLSYRQRFNEVFKENRLSVDELSVDETIVYIILPENHSNSETVKKDRVDAVVDFYTNFKPKRMKEIREKWKTHFASNKFGL